MARKLRVEYAGAIYHVMNRGDRRERIFMDDADRQRFVDTLGEACAKTGWQVHAYVLMPNHFHVVVETPQPNLVAGMKWLLGTYTSRFNRRHKLFGHLFCGRYKSLIVDGSGSGYLKKRGRLRPLESGASETGGSGSALAEFCLKQLAGVLARAL
jgi:REP element-mobilizing transposase RayT